MAQDQNRNLVAALSYLLGFITGVVILLVEEHDKYIRFHALQSTLVFGALFIANIIVGIFIEKLFFGGILATLINTIVWLAIIVVWLVSMIKAYQGKVYKWPIAGSIAEKKVK